MPQAQLEPLGGRALQLTKRTIQVIRIPAELFSQLRGTATQLIVAFDPGSFFRRQLHSGEYVTKPRPGFGIGL